MVAFFLLKGDGVSRQVGKWALGTYRGATAGSDEEIGGVTFFPLETMSALEPVGLVIGSLTLLKLLGRSLNHTPISQRDNRFHLLMIGIIRLQATTHLKSILRVNRGLARQASLLSYVKSISYLPYLGF